MPVNKHCLCHLVLWKLIYARKVKATYLCVHNPIKRVQFHQIKKWDLAIKGWYDREKVGLSLETADMYAEQLQNNRVVHGPENVRFHSCCKRVSRIFWVLRHTYFSMPALKNCTQMYWVSGGNYCRQPQCLRYAPVLYLHQEKKGVDPVFGGWTATGTVFISYCLFALFLP